MASTVDSLRNSLKVLARVQPSENIKDPDVDQAITDAMTQHNVLYSVSTLPDVEVEAVLTLGWIKLCFIRASNYASQTDVSGGSFQQEAQSPFNKCLRLASQLEKRYKQLVTGLELDNNSGTITVSDVFRKSDLMDGIVPATLSPALPPILLSLVSSSGTTIILSWETRLDANWKESYLYCVEAATLYEEWNFNSATGVPRITDNATKALTLTDGSVKSAKVLSVNNLVINHFILVGRSLSDKYVWSNELIVPAF